LRKLPVDFKEYLKELRSVYDLYKVGEKYSIGDETLVPPVDTATTPGTEEKKKK
jgi:hypothetical protein